MDIYSIINSIFNKNSIFFEIGSHFGLDTQKLLLISNHIHCFEPDPRNIEIFKKFNLPVILNEIAISDKDGIEDFYLSSGNVYESKYGPTHQDIVNNHDWSSSSSLKQPKHHLTITPWVKFNYKISVKTQRLDTYCIQNNINKIDFIWMDVQGAELDVICGIGDYKNKINYIYTEYSDYELYENQPTKQQILDYLGSDWEVLFDFGGDILLKNNNF